MVCSLDLAGTASAIHDTAPYVKADAPERSMGACVFAFVSREGKRKGVRVWRPPEVKGLL